MTCHKDRAVSPVYLSDLSPGDKPWEVHRSQSEAVETLYGAGGFQRYQERIKDCSRQLLFALVGDGKGDVVFHLQAAKFCRVRFCPVCQWRRSLMWRARFFKAMPGFLQDNPNLRPVFLTLTVRNCPVEELRETVDLMGVAFSRMTKRRWWPGESWVKSLEVTRSNNGQAHPHFHVLMFVKPSYFSHGYIKQREWRHHWAACMRLDYLPVVNVKTVKPKPQDGDDPRNAIARGILETLKYGVKPDDLIADGEWLYGMTQQLHRVRSVAVGGKLRGYLRETEVEDLIHDGDEESELAASEEDPRLLFDWHSEVKKYAQKLNRD